MADQKLRAELIDDDERLTHKVMDTSIYYRRIPETVTNRLVRKYTKKGKTDWPEVTAQSLRYIVLGWDEMALKGRVIEFIPELISKLPADVKLDLLDLAGAADTGEAAKNLKTLSPSNSTTE